MLVGRAVLVLGVDVDVIRDVQLVVVIGNQDRRRVGDDIKDDLVDLDVCGVVVVGVLGHDELVERGILGEHERAVGDVGGNVLCPRVAGRLDDILLDREKHGRRGERHKPRGVVGGLDNQRQIVRGLHAHVVRRQGAFIVFLAVFENPQIGRGTGGDLGVQNALPRVLEVMRGERRAVGPREAFLELEGIGHPVLGDFIALRAAGDIGFAVRAQLVKAREKVLKDDRGAGVGV
jgi:hypothetical protein